MLVCVGPAPTAARLIRSAARMAAGLRCPWVAVYVERSAAAMNEPDRARLEAHLRLVEALARAVTRVAGKESAAAILSYAQRVNVPRIVIGKPTHSRVRDRLRGSLVDAIVRG